jgi:adenylosuccinate synthase
MCLAVAAWSTLPRSSKRCRCSKVQAFASYPRVSCLPKMPTWSRRIDKLSGARIGTTGRGIGPAYADKALRIGVRLGDLRDGNVNVKEHLAAQCEHHGALAKTLYGHHDVPSPEQVASELLRLAEKLRPFIVDVVPALVKARASRVLYEGAQGALLDVDQGTYPFVTSSNTAVTGALAGLGVYTEFEKRIAVIKAYTTRVGNGPFPTELHGEEGEVLRARGKEYGATTGRPRRCGWLDMPALKRTFQMNAFTHVALTKLDVLSGYGDFKVVTSTGDRIFRAFEGDLTKAKTRSDLPHTCQEYLSYLETELNAKVMIVSTGPDREHTLIAEPAFG